MAVIRAIGLFFLACVLTRAIGDVCPGTEWPCATGMTCCVLPSGHEGCCPYPNATCCADKVHCCPMGSTCSDKGGGHCQNELLVKVEKVKKTITKPFKMLQLQTYIPTGATSQGLCPDGGFCSVSATCCKIKSGIYGCCPLPGAECCADLEHCCPNGFRCTADGICVRKHVKVDKQRIDNSTLSGVSTMCPGGGAECPSDNTCCSMGSGAWGCCPLPKAVCCPDQEHCCANGYKCVGTEGCAKK